MDLAAGIVLAWALIALAILGVGGRRLLRSAVIRRSGVEVPGTIVESQFRSGHGGRVWFRPVVLFRTITGVRVRAIGPIRAKAAYPRGARVILRYRADKPDRIEIVDGPGEGQGAAGYLFTGLLLLVVLVTLVGALG